MGQITVTRMEERLNCSTSASEISDEGQGDPGIWGGGGGVAWW